MGMLNGKETRYAFSNMQGAIYAASLSDLEVDSSAFSLNDPGAPLQLFPSAGFVASDSKERASCIYLGGESVSTVISNNKFFNNHHSFLASLLAKHRRVLIDFMPPGYFEQGSAPLVAVANQTLTSPQKISLLFKGNTFTDHLHSQSVGVEREYLASLVAVELGRLQTQYRFVDNRVTNCSMIGP